MSGLGRQFELDGAVPCDVRALAYIGDAVCSLFIRQRLSGAGGYMRGLTERAARMASAGGQAAAMEAILPLLTGEEADMLRRGRNAKCGAVPRNCEPAVYRRATGFEALLGWLYLQGRRERLEQLLSAAYAERDGAE